MSKAPYNFVPLNKKIIQGKAISHDEFHSNLFTGKINCELTTLTPLFIGSGVEEKKDSDNIPKYDFFNINGRYLIPGSSIRGMIRNLVEIVTYSKLKFFDDDYLYYRTFADRKPELRDLYQSDLVKKITFQRGSKTKTKGIPLSKAGYLVKEKLSYKIIPAERNENGNYYSSKKKRDLINFLNREISNKIRHIKDFSYHRLRNGQYLVITGPMNNKKLERVIHRIDTSATPINIPEEDINSYREDKSRSIKLISGSKKVDSLLKLFENKNLFPDGVPCFYREWTDENGNNRVNFGHTVMFRKVYKNSIVHSIKQERPKDEELDFTESIFGKIGENSYKGRISVTNAQPDKPLKFKDYHVINTLATPKPTSIQLYLEQEQNTTLKTFEDDDAIIRGHKRYWHKSGESWQKKDTPNPKYDKKIKPISKNCKFSFTIHFENLSDIELGALLFCIDLKEGLAHKIGMGKPLGLGSVKINSHLTLINMKERYSNLFTEGLNNWELGYKESNGRRRNFVSSFEKFILNEIGDKSDSLWNVDRISKLQKLLDVQLGKKLEKSGRIEYLKVGSKDYRDRIILPYPDDF